MRGRLIELVLAGLVADEDELLGDLAEERAYREQTDGPRARGAGTAARPCWPCPG